MAQRLVESYDQCDFSILEDTHGRPLRVGGEMQLADVKNQNGRIYSEALWRRVFDSQKTMARLRERRMVGELDHPPSGKTTARQISHVMTELKMQESKRFPGKLAVYGVYECIPTPDGKILETLHRSKIGIAVSSRGDGDLEERGGDSYVIPESYELDTFDAVMDPSVNVQVGVLESIQEKGAACSCITNKSVENLVRAIYGIVESGDFDRGAATYYRTILEGVNQDDSETYLMATEALRELKNHLEVTTVMKTENNTPGPSGITEQRAQELITENANLKEQLENANKRASAGERLCQEFMIQARAHKMQAEANLAKARELAGVKSRYESLKEVARKLREQVLTLQHEGKFRIAAERLLGALLSKIDEAKRTAYVDQLLSAQKLEANQKAEWRGALLECENKSGVNRLLKIFIGNRKVIENTQGKNLPPVTESGRRGTRIPAESPLLESNGDQQDQSQRNGTPAASPRLQEQVDFTKMVVAASKGR